jgi:hypothetical protein
LATPDLATLNWQRMAQIRSKNFIQCVAARPVLRPRMAVATAPGGESFNRVESSYQLNEFLSDSSFRSFLKGTLNSLLNVVRMGDSLKIRAEK